MKAQATLTICFLIALTCSKVLTSLKSHKTSHSPGYQLREGKREQLWSIKCHTEVHGYVYGKLNAEGDAFWSYDKKQYICDNFDIVSGEAIENEGVVPEECIEHAKKEREGVVYYPAIVKSRHGLIPGKVTGPDVGDNAFFAFDGVQLKRKTWFWYC